LRYRWHGNNEINARTPRIQPLVLDGWKTMQLVKALRCGSGFVRRFKFKGLFGVRSGIKAKCIRQMGNITYSRELVAVGRCG
jgi:hypothetical protein